MHNKFNICIIFPRMPRQKKNCFFNDVMMTSSSSPWVEHTWFGLNRSGEEEKKIRPKNYAIFDANNRFSILKTLIHQY